MIEITGLDKKTTQFVLATIGTLSVWSMISSVVSVGSISATIITFILYTSYWSYALYFKNQLVLKLVIFGTVAGLLELFADHYLIYNINSLVYPDDSLMIYSSPIYMPFAWSNVLLQLSFVGLLLYKKFGVPVASVLLAVLGGFYIPLYEYLAESAGWWIYNHNVTLILNAPLYVILCEAFIALSLPMIMLYLNNKKYYWAIAAGVFEGIWIMVGVLLTYYVAA